MVNPFILIVGWVALSTPGAAIAQRPSSIVITVDTSLADQSLDIACSGRAIDEDAVRTSPLVRAQIAHNSGIQQAATVDAYVAALRALSACTVPAPDTFRVGDILQHLDLYRRKVADIRARQQDLASSVAARLLVYSRPGLQFRRGLILAVPYFSCGGFERGEYFFIDIRCLDQNVDNDLDALKVLIAHETFHGIQARTFYPSLIDANQVVDTNTALQYLFGKLLWEGSAVYVSGANALLATHSKGPFTRLSQTFVRDNADRLTDDFSLITVLLSYASASSADDARSRAKTAEEIGFGGGSFEELGYFVGARMASDIEAARGRAALVCVMQLPAEQFVLADNAVVPSNGLKLGSDAVGAAQAVAAARKGDHDFSKCFH